VTVPETVYETTTTVPLYGLMALLYVNTLDMSTLAVGRGETGCLPRFAKVCLFDPENGLFADNLAACLNNLAVSALEQDRMEPAHLFIQQGKALGRTSFDDLEVQYYNQVAQQQANTGDSNGAVQTLWAALQVYPADPVLGDNIVYYYGLWADTFRARSDTGGVVRVFLAARQMLPGDAAVRESLKIAFYNHAVDVYNRQDFDAARAVCARRPWACFPERGLFWRF